VLEARPDKPPRRSGPQRVLRVIARMNVGGPAYHVSILCRRLDAQRFRTLLVYGRTGPGEASLADLARLQPCAVEEIGVLGPEIRPLADVRALFTLVRMIRRFRPDLVETHTAKAGMLGRLGAIIAARPRPAIVHTYHGHVLEGYFGPIRNALYRTLERALARVSDCLIGVSQTTVDDLVRLRIAPRERFRVVPLGLELDRFANLRAEQGSEFRARMGAGPDDVLLTYVGRLVPIKRVDVIIRALGEASRAGVPVRLAVVGDGESRVELEALAVRWGVADRIGFVGYMLDITPAFAACDIAVLSSDNEGTPVSLIEAAAAGRPSVATAVGGVPEVVTSGAGILVPPGDHRAFAAAVAQLAGDAELRAGYGARARKHVLERFSTARLIADLEALYEELLDGREVS
jgi:glycosyltransferase involved in cell wall biosynthesis